MKLKNIYKLIESIDYENIFDMLYELSRNIINIVQAESVGIYFLSLKNSKYYGFIGVNKDGYFDEMAGIEYEKNENEICLDIERNNVVVCKLCIKSGIDEKIIEYIEYFSKLLLVAYDKKFINNFFGAVQRPLNYKKIDIYDFFKNIMQLVSDASGMGMIALRELKEDGSLECIGLHGFVGRNEKDFDWSTEEIPKEFRSVLKRPQINIVDHAEECEWIIENDLYRIVKSFIIIPVLVGDQVFGVLSFATNIEYTFNDTEILAFESLANGIGVAIANYRNYHEAADDMANNREMAVRITAIEVAQSARHEALNIIHELQGSIAMLIHDKKARISDKEDLINDISEKILDMSNSIEKIRLATRLPEKNLEKICLSDVWSEAKSSVIGRLDQYGIMARYDGPKVLINAYPDWLKHAFLNLFLNSIDAFKKSSIKRNRLITLSVDKVSEKTKSVTCYYSDNAGGIDFAKLYIPDEVMQKNLPKTQVIFEPDVTSKKNDGGSGYGLFIVRNSIQIHEGGTIDLVDYKNGVRFKIVLPKSE